MQKGLLVTDITDGRLSEKEKQIFQKILNDQGRSPESEGIDLDGPCVRIHAKVVMVMFPEDAN